MSKQSKIVDFREAVLLQLRKLSQRRSKEMFRKLRDENERLIGEQYGMADWVQMSRDLEKENAQLKFELEQERKIDSSIIYKIRLENEKLKKEVELARKIHWLLKTDQIFLGGFIINDEEEKAAECMEILCNDVFVPAADCEHLHLEELDDYIAFVKKYPRAGSIAWVANKRELNSFWKEASMDKKFKKEFDEALEELRKCG